MHSKGMYLGLQGTRILIGFLRVWAVVRQKACMHVIRANNIRSGEGLTWQRQQIECTRLQVWFVVINPENPYSSSRPGLEVNPLGVYSLGIFLPPFFLCCCYATTQLAFQLHKVFWFLVCYAATQLATQARQRYIQVVRSNKEARKRLTESNGTPAMDFGCEEIRKRKYTQMKNRTKHTSTIVHNSNLVR